MAYDDEKSNKPREMVHRAQAQSAQRLHEFRLALQGEHGAPEPDRAARRLHAAVMLYWEQIKRFAGESRLEKLWHEEQVAEIDGEQRTLDGLRDLRLSERVSVEQTTDPETNATKTVETRDPWRLSPQQALAVYDQLDRCANALGFDAKPTRDASETGAGVRTDTDGAADSAEEMDHINAEVEI